MRNESCLYCGSKYHHIDLDGSARVIACDNCGTRVPIGIWNNSPNPPRRWCMNICDGYAQLAESEEQADKIAPHNRLERVWIEEINFAASNQSEFEIMEELASRIANYEKTTAIMEPGEIRKYWEGKTEEARSFLNWIQREIVTS